MTLNPTTKWVREMFYNRVMLLCRHSLRSGASVKELIFVLDIIKRKLKEGEVNDK